MPLCSLEEGLEELKAGRFLVVVDDENRENEGDLVMPAEMVTPDAVNFIVTHARGLLCMPMIGERLDELQMPLMVSQNGSEKKSDCVHRVGGLQREHHHRHFRRRPRRHDSRHAGPSRQTRAIHPSRSPLPAAVPSRRRAGPGRSH